MSGSTQKPVGTAAAPPPVDVNNVQGDIITQIPKKAQAFFFFQITNVKGFKAALTKFIPSIATEASVTKGVKAIADHKKSGAPGLLDLRFTTIGFSSKGLVALGIKDNVNDPSFTSGQLANAAKLGDKGTTVNGVFEPDWLFPFKHDIHGLLSVSACSVQLAQLELTAVILRFLGTIREVYRVIGSVRPGAEAGHEHFGFLDGVSNPAIRGLSEEVNVGDDSVDPGVVLIGRKGDSNDAFHNENLTQRPAWTLDSSILVFRQLNQLVPEFNKFLHDNALPTVDKSVDGAELLGARLIGRWKSGAPIVKAPTKDNPDLVKSPKTINDFDYDLKSSVGCPFATHVRKAYPRNDHPIMIGSAGPFDEHTFDEPHRLLRRGIQFGPELTATEKANQKTELDRGLLFVNYNSDVGRGFEFVQQTWANNTGFPLEKPNPPGFDAIIGQDTTHLAPTDLGTRSIIGTDPAKAPETSLKLPTEWVIPKGGEYFLTPSIAALKSTIVA